MTVCCTSVCTEDRKFEHMIVFIISSGRGAQKLVFDGRKRLDVAIDAAIVCNEGETGRLPIFSITGLSVGIFMKLGFVEIDQNESQTLKSKLLKLASPEENLARLHRLHMLLHGCDMTAMKLDISMMQDSNIVLFSTFRVFGQFQCLVTRLS